jgi:predicted transcriptional regulator of viral defense system
MAAVLTCGPGAVLSHRSAAALWQISEEKDRVVHVTVPASRDIRQPSLIAHRRSTLDPADVSAKDGIPVTTPIRTLIDLGTRITTRELEAAINEADKLDLVDPQALRQQSLREGVSMGSVGFAASSIGPPFSSLTRSWSGDSSRSRSGLACRSR